MKMKRLPYKRLVKGVIREVRKYIRTVDQVGFYAFIYADPFTGDVRLDDCPENGHYHGKVAMFLTAGLPNEKKTPDERSIEHWVRVDLRKYAERVFEGQRTIEKLFATTS